MEASEIYVTATWFDPCIFIPTAWNGYCNKYINVKKGGAAGVSMLLAGYCILSYGWSYQHISKISFLMSYFSPSPSAAGGKSVCYPCCFKL